MSEFLITNLFRFLWQHREKWAQRGKREGIEVPMLPLKLGSRCLYLRELSGSMFLLLQILLTVRMEHCAEKDEANQSS